MMLLKLPFLRPSSPGARERARVLPRSASLSLPFILSLFPLPLNGEWGERGGGGEGAILASMTRRNDTRAKAMSRLEDGDVARLNSHT